tara:strand:- start:228 stop:560 length:333 start_codon:yes stop_codon:yes gene_type:complete
MDNLKKVQKHFNFKFVEEWHDGLDFYIYEESTADGYSVYVATVNPKNLVIEEDVYYYDSDLSSALVDVIENNVGEFKETMEIYIGDVEHLDYVLEEAIEELEKIIENKNN